MIEKVLYLDTNHISSLVRRPEAAESRAVMTLLQANRAYLAFSIFHIIELSAPTFKSYGDVCDLLDKLPVAWAIHFPNLFDAEIDAAFARVVGGKPRPVEAFFTTPAEAWGDPQPPLRLLKPFGHIRDFARAFCNRPRIVHEQTPLTRPTLRQSSGQTSRSFLESGINSSLLNIVGPQLDCSCRHVLLLRMC
jgi:hypothetical protein